MKSENGSVGIKILIALLILLVIATGALIAIKVLDKNSTKSVNTEDTQEPEKVKEPIKIFTGTNRPIAVMIDNHEDAWPQGGLNQTYIVYECLVEGGETRLMALFKGEKAEKIGPVRSSRHYYLDYALENDAIYTHYGWSPQAEYDISTLKIQNINGITQSTSSFWRTKDKYSPHNVATSIEELTKIAEQKKYALTSEKKSVLNYVSKSDEIMLEEEQDAISVTIPFSNLQTVKYIYNNQTSLYERYARGEEQTDWETGNMVTAKNLIITLADYYTLADSENKGRLGLNNIGDKDGYYITNGKVQKIVCSKSSREAQTVYKTLDGTPINVNDGRTFISICPTNAKIIFEAPAVETTQGNEVTNTTTNTISQ